MSKDPHYWLHSRKNLNNPTFISSQVLTSLQPQYNKNMTNLKQIQLESRSEIYQSANFTLPNVKNRQNSQLQKQNPQKPSTMLKSGNSIMRNYSQLNKSQMTGNMIRSNSYSHFQTEAKDIFQNQQKNFNIINLKPKIYKSSLNLFPKYRLERMDSDYKLRQAYLKGDIQTVSKLKNIITENIQLENSKYLPSLVKAKKSNPNFDINQKIFVNNSSKLQWKF